MEKKWRPDKETARGLKELFCLLYLEKQKEQIDPTIHEDLEKERKEFCEQEEIDPENDLKQKTERYKKKKKQ